MYGGAAHPDCTHSDAPPPLESSQASVRRAPYLSQHPSREIAGICGRPRLFLLSQRAVAGSGLSSFLYDVCPACGTGSGSGHAVLGPYRQARRRPSAPDEHAHARSSVHGRGGLGSGGPAPVGIVGRCTAGGPIWVSRRLCFVIFSHKCHVDELFVLPVNTVVHSTSF